MPHKNGIITLALFLLRKRGRHSDSCPVVNKTSNEAFLLCLVPGAPKSKRSVTKRMHERVPSSQSSNFH